MHSASISERRCIWLRPRVDRVPEGERGMDASSPEVQATERIARARGIRHGAPVAQPEAGSPIVHERIDQVSPGTVVIRTRPGAPVRFQFQQYLQPTVFEVGTTEIRGADYVIRRDPHDATRITVQSRVPFTHDADSSGVSAGTERADAPERRDDTAGRTLDVPPGSPVVLTFEGYGPMTFMPADLSMGDLATNGFCVRRSPQNRGQITVESRLPYRYQAGAVTGSSADSVHPRRQPDTRQVPDAQRDPEPRPRPRQAPPSNQVPPERPEAEAQVSDASFVGLAYSVALPSGPRGSPRITQIRDCSVTLQYDGEAKVIDCRDCLTIPALRERLQTAARQMIDGVASTVEQKRVAFSRALERVQTLMAQASVPSVAGALEALRSACEQVNSALETLQASDASVTLRWPALRHVSFAPGYLVRVEPGRQRLEVTRDEMVIVPDSMASVRRDARLAEYRRRVEAYRGQDFISDDCRSHLRAIGRVTSGAYAFEERDGKFLITVASGSGTETWQVRRPGVRYAQYPEDFLLTKLRPDGSWEERGSVLCDTLFTAQKAKGSPTGLQLVPGWTRVVEDCRRQVEQNRSSEEADAADIRNFDIPRDRPIGTFQINSAATADDALTRSGPDSFQTFTELLAARGHTMVRPSRGLSISVDRAPVDIVRSTLREFAGRGIRDVYLNINAHGSDAFYFPARVKPDGSADSSAGNYRLTHADLMRVFREFPDMRVTINSVACYGAWQNVDGSALRDQSGAPEGRVTVFTQTTPETFNVNTNAYDTALFRYLSERTTDGSYRYTYGQAHLLADRDVQAATGFNPRVRRSSPRGAGYNETARNDRDRRPFESAEPVV